MTDWRLEWVLKGLKLLLYSCKTHLDMEPVELPPRFCQARAMRSWEHLVLPALPDAKPSRGVLWRGILKQDPFP